MARVTRRRFLSVSAAGAAAGVSPGGPSPIRVEHVAFSYEDFRYRVPIKFGGVVADRVTLLNVDCVVRTANGGAASGFGSMPLGNIWAFPSKAMPYDTTLAAMKALAERIAKLTAACPERGDPIGLNRRLEPAYLRAADEASRALGLPEPIPKLATLVVASPFDAVLHDAYGKAHGLNCYRTYGPDHLPHDLGHYLGAGVRGEHLGRYVLADPKKRLPVYHLVGAVDPILESDLGQRLHHGHLPPHRTGPGRGVGTLLMRRGREEGER